MRFLNPCVKGWVNAPPAPRWLSCVFPSLSCSLTLSLRQGCGWLEMWSHLIGCCLTPFAPHGVSSPCIVVVKGFALLSRLQSLLQLQTRNPSFYCLLTIRRVICLLASCFFPQTSVLRRKLYSAASHASWDAAMLVLLCFLYVGIRGHVLD